MRIIPNMPYAIYVMPVRRLRYPFFSQFTFFKLPGNNFYFFIHFCCRHYLSSGLFQASRQQFLLFRSFLLSPLSLKRLISSFPATIFTFSSIFVATTISQA